MKRNPWTVRSLFSVVAVAGLLLLNSCVSMNLVSQRAAGVDATAGASSDATDAAPAPAAPAN
jgi:hypothetical protein